MMAAQSLIQQEMSLNKALHWCGVTKKRWYYKPKARKSAINRDMLQIIQQIREERPFYGTRRMAAEFFRMLECPVNCKLARRVYQRMGRSLPAQDIKCAKGLLDANQSGPPQPGLGDGHRLHLVRSRRRRTLLLQRPGHLHQVVDAYRFDTLATASVAVESFVEAVTASKPAVSD